MLDIKIIRENPEKIKQNMKNRNMNLDKEIDKLLEIDILRRNILNNTEQKKSQQNLISKQIPVMKKNNQDVSGIMSEMKVLSDEITSLKSQVSELEKTQREILLSIPNVPNSTVPVGKSDENNIEIRKWGTPREFDFEPKAHWDLGKNLNILDPERAAKITGARFHIYKNLGARLERAIINFYLDTHTSNNYQEILPPFIVNSDSMTGTGQLPKFKDDAFKLNNLDYYLVPTAEVPVTNMFRDEILDGNNLTQKFCAYTACFRAEAGSAGRDTRGLIRQHQFNKVELVKFSKPENSYQELESLTQDAENLLQKLNLPYRIINLCTGDLGFSSAKTYDIEVWMPSYNKYLEISSCSNFEDYQARRMNIKYKNNSQDKAQYVHTLNGSGLAVGRTVAAILENYQNSDGTVNIPEVLQKYMNTNIIKN